MDIGNHVPIKDRSTGEYKCKRCGNFFTPEEGDSLLFCPECYERFSLKVEAEVKRRGGNKDNG